MLLQHLVSPLPRGATATPSDAGDPAGNDAAAYGLAALPPKVATAVQPRLAAVLRSATDPTQREASAWVLGEWATMPGACNTEVLTALTVALIDGPIAFLVLHSPEELALRARAHTVLLGRR